MKKYETPNSHVISVETEVSFVESSHFVPRKNPCKNCSDYYDDVCDECLYRDERHYLNSGKK